MRLIACLSFIFVILLIQHAQAQINVEQPPSGSLSEEQLQTIAADIRKLLEDPLAPGAEQGRKALWQWITGSPDVTVKVCPNIIGPLTESNYTHKTKLIILSVLSSAAYKIENPDTDSLAEQVNGIKGMLQAYQVIKEQEDENSTDPFIESLQKFSQKGELASHLRDEVEKCY